MGVSFETYLQRHWDVQRDVVTTSVQRLVAGWVLLTCQILGLFVHTLNADEMYLLLHRDNLTITIQMQLSEKQKKFSEFFAEFLKCISNFERFGTKDHPHRYCISEITNSENVLR